MNLKEQISNDLKQAMKDKNMVKLNVLRVLKAEIERNEQTANGKVELTDADIIKQVKKMIEGLKETKYEDNEMSTLEIYLPKQLNNEEITFVIKGLKESNITNIGDIMKFFKTNYDGLYDGKEVSNLIKELV